MQVGLSDGVPGEGVLEVQVGDRGEAEGLRVGLVVRVSVVILLEGAEGVSVGVHVFVAPSERLIDGPVKVAVGVRVGVGVGEERVRVPPEAVPVEVRVDAVRDGDLAEAVQVGVALGVNEELWEGRVAVWERVALPLSVRLKTGLWDWLGLGVGADSEGEPERLAVRVRVRVAVADRETVVRVAAVRERERVSVGDQDRVAGALGRLAVGVRVGVCDPGVTVEGVRV